MRLSFIWASENIATNTPDIYEDHMQVFEKLLHDADDKVRMEAPEIFRVLGKRRPEFVRPYVEQLRQISDTDENRVVRIHCLGAIKATESKQKLSKDIENKPVVGSDIYQTMIGRSRLIGAARVLSELSETKHHGEAGA